MTMDTPCLACSIGIRACGQKCWTAKKCDWEADRTLFSQSSQLDLDRPIVLVLPVYLDIVRFIVTMEGEALVKSQQTLQHETDEAQLSHGLVMCRLCALTDPPLLLCFARLFGEMLWKVRHGNDCGSSENRNDSLEGSV
jgi:hypothetical protein